MCAARDVTSAYLRSPFLTLTPSSPGGPCELYACDDERTGFSRIAEHNTEQVASITTRALPLSEQWQQECAAETRNAFVLVIHRKAHLLGLSASQIPSHFAFRVSPPRKPPLRFQAMPFARRANTLPVPWWCIRP